LFGQGGEPFQLIYVKKLCLVFATKVWNFILFCELTAIFRETEEMGMEEGK